MRILLSDGSGLTSRQVATQAAAAGHTVEVVAPTRLGLAGVTRHVRRVHVVPALGRDPDGWLEATLDVLARRQFDVLVPTQEQVAVLAHASGAIHALGVGLAVPSFASVARVQDKLAQAATLEGLGLPCPPTTIARSAEEALAVAHAPAFLKAPVGTASAGVHRAGSAAEVRAAIAVLAHAGAFADGGVVVQSPLDGPLAMLQAVFARGRLIAWHANLRTREGLGGGASGKRSVRVPAAGEHLARLGSALDWHGALALDAILTPDGPVYIDINPRLVEPGNAWRSGVDLVDVLLRVSLDRPVEPVPPARDGVDTHQLLLALLAAGSRRALLRELAAALTHRGPYAHSTEELTPLRGDARSALPLLLAVGSTLIHPPLTRSLADGGVAAYALTPAAWRHIAGPAAPPAPPVAHGALAQGPGCAVTAQGTP